MVVDCQPLTPQYYHIATRLYSLSETILSKKRLSQGRYGRGERRQGDYFVIHFSTFWICSSQYFHWWSPWDSV